MAVHALGSCRTAAQVRVMQCHGAPWNRETWAAQGPQCHTCDRSPRDPSAWLSGTPGLDPSTSLFFPSGVPALPRSLVSSTGSCSEKGEHDASQSLPMLQSMFLTQGVSAPLVAEMHLLAVTSITLACLVF